MFQSKLLPRCFVLAVMALIAIDAWPPQSWCVRVKKPIGHVMDWIGLRQGSWAMFAPNPVVNNRWMSADIELANGQSVHWDSPIWSRASTWDKFVKFRHINYYNRVFQTWCMAGRNDFLEYLIREQDDSVDSIQLHLNRMALIMPEDGSLPVREETQWQLISEPWIGKSKTP